MIGFLAVVAVAAVATPTTAARHRPPRAELQAFRACMEARGVEKPDRGERPTEAQKAKFEAAFEQCKSLLPERLRQRLEQRQELRQCLRNHGVTWPKRERGERPNLTEEQRATLRSALAACGDLRPHGPGPGHRSGR
jgi:hypothetical protein